MKKVNRRTFFSTSLMAAAAVSLPISIQAKNPALPLYAENSSKEGPGIIDTNVNLFEWPFRRLKYSDTHSLIAKLRSHQIHQAWAGSFEALFHKDMDAVNTRLAEECRKIGEGMLLPFGSLNLAWPDWEEDLRRCHEVHGMAGIRIYPSYQTFDLTHPEFPRFIQLIAKTGLILQIVGDMDDARNHHPIVLTRNVDMEPLVELMKKEPKAKVQLIYWNHRVNNQLMARLVKETSAVFDIARIETSGGVGRLIEGSPWSGPAHPVPVDRLLFGSHAPYFPVEANILKLFESPLSLDQAKAIMEGNAQKLVKHV
jgi:predicted TIM-barrel fold metal-dependent hydrolase